MTTRRNFIKKTGAGFLAATAASLTVNGKLYGQLPEKAPQRNDLFKLAIAGFSFARFNIDDSLKMMQRMDVHYLCLKDFHLPLDSNEEQIAAFHAKLAEKNVTGYAAGPIYMGTEAEATRAFDYAKRVGVTTVVGVPYKVVDNERVASPELLQFINLKVREYDCKYAIHNHGPDMPKLFPNAASVIELVKDLDPRIGICLDIGHDIRDGFDPCNDLQKYSDRVFDIHIKDVTAASKEGRTCEMGRGVIDIPRFVKMLRSVGYSGACSLEFEKDMDDPLAGLAESIGYFRGVADSTKTKVVPKLFA